MSDDNPGVRLPPPVIVLAGLAVGLALDGRLADPRSNGALVALGIACAGAGLWFGISALGLFHRHSTKAEPWKPSSALVTSGAYRFTRNPMYVGMLLLYVGLALIAGGFWTGVAIVPVFLTLNFYVIAREEAYLERRFGTAYTAYRGKVRRWF